MYVNFNLLWLGIYNFVSLWLKIYLLLMAQICINFSFYILIAKSDEKHEKILKIFSEISHVK